MKRKPLAEEPVRLQSIADGLEMFLRVKRSGSVLSRMEQIGEDHIVAIRRGADEAPSVRRAQGYARISLWSAIHRLELSHHLDHLRQKFHAIHLQPRMDSGRPERDPGS